MAEKAKRRLIAELYELKLPIVGRDEDPHYGLAFDLLSSEFEKVFTGHENGVITLDLAEGDDVHREQLRISMDEPYRTLLGHFRHEIGHYYFYRLVGPSPDYTAAVPASCSATPTPTTRPRWTATTTKGAAGLGGRLRVLLRHHAPGRGLGGNLRALPAHPRHPGHRRGVRIRAGGCDFERRVLGPSGFDTIIDMWLPLAWALNMVNRSMGKEDLYPFVLPPAVLEKMRFVHTIIDEITSDPAKLADVSGGGQQQSQT